ncbi:hypothetical protein BJ944DRAFT_256200 [Cunninghamella echinulata]|nr:hypothetical protein BJ944DRAFT_256200 [Cunninghamella echinulata]
MSFPYFKLGKSSTKQSSTSSKNGSTGSNGSQDKIQPENIPLEAKFPDINYEYIEGRNFNRAKNGKTNLLPCDDEECERLEIAHLLLNCGPGYWIKEIAKLYPNSHFVGIDDIIYPISITEEAIRITKPGGYIEFLEASHAYNDIGPNFSLWLMRMTVSMQTRGLNSKVGTELEQLLTQSGQMEIHESTHRSAPLGWLGRTGDLTLECFLRLCDSLKPRLCEDWSMPVAKYEATTSGLASECQEFKSWTNVYCVSARKKDPTTSILTTEGES